MRSIYETKVPLNEHVFVASFVVLLFVAFAVPRMNAPAFIFGEPPAPPPQREHWSARLFGSE